MTLLLVSSSLTSPWEGRLQGAALALHTGARFGVTGRTFLSWSGVSGAPWLCLLVTRAFSEPTAGCGGAPHPGPRGPAAPSQWGRLCDRGWAASLGARAYLPPAGAPVCLRAVLLETAPILLGARGDRRGLPSPTRPAWPGLCWRDHGLGRRLRSGVAGGWRRAEVGRGGRLHL